MTDADLQAQLLVLRKRLEELSAQQQRFAFEETRFRVVAMQTGQLIYDYDASTGQITWAGAVEDLTGHTELEFASIDIAGWTELIHPDDRPKAVALLEEAQARVARYRVQYRFRRKHGDYIVVDDRGVFLPAADGSARRMLGTMSDVTHQRKLEDQLRHKQKLEGLGLLAGGIAHDFNNLLTTIVGSAELLRATMTQESARPHLEAIMTASRRAGDMCRQLLAYAGKAPLLVGPVDLHALLTELPDLLKLALRDRGELVLRLLPESLIVRGSADQLRQVIVNLVVNAAEALVTRGGRIELSTSRETFDAQQLAAARGGELKPGSYVVITVRDDGCGMDTQTLQQIFDPFFSTKFAGRGLGLAAVLGIVSSHDGAVLIDSAPGCGSTFRLLLPSEAVQAEQPTPAPNADSTESLEGEILLVDDEEVVRTVVGKLVEHLGLTVFPVVSGEAAVAALKQEPKRIAGAILDMTMPGLDGVETLRLLRQIRPGLPVLLCSGLGESDVSALLADPAPTAFLSKPFTLDALKLQLHALLALGKETPVEGYPPRPGI